MLPGPLLPPHPPPPPLVLIGSHSEPSPSPSDPPPSLPIGSSLAIIVIIIIATVTVTTCIVVLRRGCRRQRLSCSSFSPHRSSSPMASFSSSSAESGMQSAATASVGASPRDRAAMSFLETAMVSSAMKDAGKASDAASLAHSAEGPVKESELVVSLSAPAVMMVSGVEMLKPSAPSLPEVERLILELLSLPAGPMKPGRSTVCLICSREFLPTDVLLVLPVCSHVFHQSCIVTWLRRTAASRCPSCHASITIPCPDKTNFCPDEYDIEAQVLVPAPPGEEAVGGSRGWLRSSLDRLSGGWMGCSSNRATAVVAPVSSQRTSGSWSLGSSGRLGNDTYQYCVEAHMRMPVLPGEEVSEAVGSSRGWLRSSLATLSGSWSGCSSSHSTAMALPVYSRHTTEPLGSNGDSSMDSWSRRWDLEAATPTPERPSVYDYVRWFFRSSDNGREDALAKVAAEGGDLPLGTFFETLYRPSDDSLDEAITIVLPIETPNLRASLFSFLSGMEELDNLVALCRMEHHAKDYLLVDGALSKIGVCAPFLREIHEGLCGNHLAPHALAGKALRQGLY
ncbi:uncharacterized protein LOC133884029 [Phragmites australis]|uniref:uncharacterized protein LOC133884029 n=1 Tax=Phragmites australis TaxID=29695 RepID=UPI002D799FF8|nr:uncharacterized protein LOC133884029 [Phragmites australis]